MKNRNYIERRHFLRSSALAASGALALSAMPDMTRDVDENPNIIGPRQGFAPHIGTLLSMLSWMRGVILRPVQGMTSEQLDYLHDKHSNSIGAMLLHLAATERFYQVHTFEGKRWGDWSEEDKKRFQVAMRLGKNARNTIKGNDFDFYLTTLQEVRERTVRELKNRDDDWLFSIDETWSWGPTNNYCKWFHVCEHESNHNGQIKYIKTRLPGAKPGSD